jgi:hypothetical protein
VGTLVSEGEKTDLVLALSFNICVNFRQVIYFSKPPSVKWSSKHKLKVTERTFGRLS